MHKILFDHLLITRFSYRGADSCSVSIDPLNKHRLEKRFDIFESVCLPSIVAQQEKNFTWILIIDAQLPAVFRDRLDNLTDRHTFIRLHTYQPETRIETLGWLKVYCNPGVKYVVTTVLDDDDALSFDYIKTLQHHIHALGNNIDTLPDLKVLGCKNGIQWDYYPASQSPLGYIKPWLRRRGTEGAFPLQSGFSVFTHKKALNISAYYFRHTLGDLFLIEDEVFDQLPLATRRRIQDKRDNLKNAAEKSGQSWKHLCEQGAFQEISPEKPCVLMVNTMTNLQKDRLFEYPNQRRPVINNSSFTGFGIDLEAARRSIPFHGCTLSNFLASVLPACKAEFQDAGDFPHVGFARKLKRSVKLSSQCIKGIFYLRK